jgi:hypothetical protein
VTADEIDSLVRNRVRENRHLEYKSALPTKGGSERTPFLHGIASFANTDGGNYLIGIREENGVPIEIVGLADGEIETIKLAIEQMIKAGIEPSAIVEIDEVTCNNEKLILVLRVPRSWLAPHRTASDQKFYARNSSGKYPMDVDELRAAFLRSATIGERVESFRASRLQKLVDGTARISGLREPLVLLQLIPYESLDPLRRVDILKASRQGHALAPLGSRGVNTSTSYRYNFDGYYCETRFKSRDEKGSFVGAYLQLFRSGIVETGNCELISRSSIPNLPFEARLISCCKRLLPVQFSLGLELPTAVVLTLTGVLGCGLDRLGQNTLDAAVPIDRARLLFTPAIVHHDHDEVAEVMRPIFDELWNSVGYDRCLDYGNDGRLHIDETWFENDKS